MSNLWENFLRIFGTIHRDYLCVQWGSHGFGQTAEDSYRIPDCHWVVLLSMGFPVSLAFLILRFLVPASLYRDFIHIPSSNGAVERDQLPALGRFCSGVVMGFACGFSLRGVLFDTAAVQLLWAFSHHTNVPDGALLVSTSMCMWHFWHHHRRSRSCPTSLTGFRRFHVTNASCVSTTVWLLLGSCGIIEVSSLFHTRGDFADDISCPLLTGESDGVHVEIPNPLQSSRFLSLRSGCCMSHILFCFPDSS
jgi:hypothetical protein